MVNNLLFILTTLIFLGCSPKYKILYDYQPAFTNAQKSCIQNCYQDFKRCKINCNKTDQICKKRVYSLAKQEYKAKLDEYQNQLNEYNIKYRKFLQYKNERDELKHKLLYFEEQCKKNHDSYACDQKGYYQVKLDRFNIVYKPRRPFKPNFNDILSQKEKLFCTKNCSCTELYNKCYIGCGLKVKSKKICIENCD